MSLLGIVRMPFALPKRKRPEEIRPIGVTAPVLAGPSIGAISTIGPRRPRRSLTLLRALNADCPSCRGIGCTHCAGTGIG